MNNASLYRNGDNVSMSVQNIFEATVDTGAVTAIKKCVNSKIMKICSNKRLNVLKETRH